MGARNLLFCITYLRHYICAVLIGDCDLVSRKTMYLSLQIRKFLSLAFCCLTAASCQADPVIDTNRVIARFQANSGEHDSLDSVFSNIEWDTACHIEAYDSVVSALWRHNQGNYSDYNIKPRHTMLEDESGILLINNFKKTIYVIPVPSLGEEAIYQITGKICVERSKSKFVVEKIKARNMTYRELKFLGN